MFEDFENKELIDFIMKSFKNEEATEYETLSDKVSRITCAISVCTFLQMLFRIQGFDDDLFQVIRGQLAQFVMKSADINYVRELRDLNQHLFSNESESLLLGLQRLFDTEDGPEAFQTALESLEGWEEEMKQLYFLYLTPSNDIPI